MPALMLGGMQDMVAAELFGANILAHRDTLSKTSRFENLVDDSNINAMRYPGGSVTEDMFDLSDPDSALATDRETGETSSFVPLSEFMAMAEDRGLAVTLVVPTRDQLSEDMDANGDRFADVDEEILRGFVRDTVSGTYGDARIEAFEIGNEYWGSGRMSATEYGRVASRIAEIINDELTGLAPEHPQAEGIDIVVQMGTNFAYSSLDEDYQGATGDDILADLNAAYDLELGDEVLRGNGEVNWIAVNNQIIMSYFDDPSEYGAVGAIAAHVYSKEPDMDGQRSLMLNAIEQSWGQDPRFEDVGTYVTEWSRSAASSLYERHEDFGLFQAHEMLNLVEEFSRMEVDRAHVWPLMQNSSNALSNGRDYDELSPSGQFYSMMADTLPNMRMLDFSLDDPRETESSMAHADVHGFYGNGEVVFYIASTADATRETIVDMDNLFDDVTAMSIRKLGVDPGNAPGSNTSTAALTESNPQHVYDEGYLTAALAPGEIMEVRITGFDPTVDFARVIGVIDAEDAEVSVEPDAGADPLTDLAPVEAPDPAPDTAPPDTVPVVVPDTNQGSDQELPGLTTPGLGVLQGGMDPVRAPTDVATGAPTLGGSSPEPDATPRIDTGVEVVAARGRVPDAGQDTGQDIDLPGVAIPGEVDLRQGFGGQRGPEQDAVDYLLGASGSTGQINTPGLFSQSDNSAWEEDEEDDPDQPPNWAQDEAIASGAIWGLLPLLALVGFG